jgi:hypothetical protein
MYTLVSLLAMVVAASLVRAFVFRRREFCRSTSSP